MTKLEQFWRRLAWTEHDTNRLLVLSLLCYIFYSAHFVIFSSRALVAFL